ncbi:MAG: DUF1853 family protein [Burkholderiales bacterium]|nr:DUF1853 family protein [Burkholderiales bacterium]
MLSPLLATLHHADVRRLAWAIGSPSLFDAHHPDWQGRLRDDTWSQRELARCHDWLIELDRDPIRRQVLLDALGDPAIATPLGHTFEKLVLFWQAARPDVRAATRGLIVRDNQRTVGEFDIVLLRHDGVIETLEVTVKYYLNLRPDLGMPGCIGPRSFDRMAEKYAKMTTRQTDLGHTEAGRAAIVRWLATLDCAPGNADTLVVDSHAIARGYVFHSAEGDACPTELSPSHARGRWQTDALPLPDEGGKTPPWRLLAGREWLGPYRGSAANSGWPNDPAMPLLMARLEASDSSAGNASYQEVERRFVVRADAGLFNSFDTPAASAAAATSA